MSAESTPAPTAARLARDVTAMIKRARSGRFGDRANDKLETTIKLLAETPSTSLDDVALKLEAADRYMALRCDAAPDHPIKLLVRSSAVFLNGQLNKLPMAVLLCGVTPFFIDVYLMTELLELL